MTTRRILAILGALFVACALVALIAWRIVSHRRQVPDVIVVSVANEADAEMNERSVLEPLEQMVGNEAHLASLEGRATRDGATLFVTLDRGVDPFLATQQIQQAVVAKLNLLPANAMPPLVMRDDIAEGPRFYVKSDAPLATIREHVDDRILLALAQLDGVGQVTACGGDDPAIVVDVDPDELVATGIDVIALANAIKAAAGTKTAADLRDVRVGIVRVSDVANVSEDGRPSSCVAFGVDAPRVVGSLAWQPGAHPEKEVDAELTKQQAFLPAGMKIVRFDFDRTRVRAFVQLDEPFTANARIAVVKSIAKAAKVADVEDVLVTSPREPRAGVDLEVEATLPERTSRAKILDTRRALASAIRELTPSMKLLTATDDDPPLVLRVIGADLDQVRHASLDVRDALEKSPALHGVLDLGARTRVELAPRIDRAIASDLGVSTVDVARAIRIATHGERVGTSSKPIWIELRDPLQAYTQLRVRGTTSLVPIASVVSMQQDAHPEDIEHWDRERAVTLWIEGTRRDAQAALQNVSLPPGVRLVWEKN